MKKQGKDSSARPLTAGEVALAKSVFGDSIDYTTVTVSDKPYTLFQPKGVATAPDGKLYMHGCYSPDYSDTNPYTRSLFIHEMTHVWQFQNKILNPISAALDLNIKHKFNYAASYDFQLDEKKDLVEYGMEEQAAMVQEYFLIKNQGLAGYTRHCKNTCEDDEKLRLYEKVLEKFLKDPSYARQAQFPKLSKKGPKL